MPVVVSDIHFHNWAMCSNTVNGMNSRLQDTLNATREAFDFALKQDKKVLFAGDLIHTRGSLTPSVFNEVTALWKEYEEKGLEFIMIAGNHDSEDLDAKLGRTALDSLASDNCIVITNGFGSCPIGNNRFVWCYAWVNDIKQLQEMLEEHSKTLYKPSDVVMIHAPVNGFVPEISGGLDPEFLTNLTSGVILVGHTHKFCSYKNKVFSIGSLTQQNFGDAGKKLGFLYLGSNNNIKQYETKAPHFLDITRLDPSVSFAKEVSNSFVRVNLERCDQAKKDNIEKQLIKMKPLDLQFRYTPNAPTLRQDVIETSTLTSQQATVRYINKQKFMYKDETKQEAFNILQQIGSDDE